MIHWILILILILIYSQNRFGAFGCDCYAMPGPLREWIYGVTNFRFADLLRSLPCVNKLYVRWTPGPLEFRTTIHLDSLLWHENGCLVILLQQILNFGMLLIVVGGQFYSSQIIAITIYHLKFIVIILLKYQIWFSKYIYHFFFSKNYTILFRFNLE